MRLLGIVGSRRRNGNTAYLVRKVLDSAAGASGGQPAEVELLFLADYRIEACTGCAGCAGSWDCIIRDEYPRLVEAIDGADAVVLGSPTYWYSVTSDMKRFIDRSYSLIDYPNSRHEWIGKYMESGKRCVTVAVCEQQEEEMMGNTSKLLTSFAEDIGLPVVAAVKALGFFEAGSVKDSPHYIDEAERAGAALREAIS